MKRRNERKKSPQSTIRGKQIETGKWMRQAAKHLKSDPCYATSEEGKPSNQGKPDTEFGDRRYTFLEGSEKVASIRIALDLSLNPARAIATI
jgi:hypothetical protein